MRALVTGASSGIGLELAHVMAEKGWDLVLVARNAEKLQELAQELQTKHNVSVETIPADLSDPAVPQKLLRETAARGLQIDALVNNAGVGSFGPFADIDLDTDVKMLELNVAALTKLTKHFLRLMLVRKKGYILNVASTAAFQPGPLMAVYYASKAYVLHFSEALANEVKGSGVSVTCLCPGMVKTGFQDAANMAGSKLLKHVMLDARKVAQEAFDAMLRGKAVVVPSLRHKILANSSRFGPRGLVTSAVRWIQETDKS